MSKATLLQLINIVRIESLLLFIYLVSIRTRLDKPWRSRVAIGFTIVMGVTVAILAYVTYEYKIAGN